MTAIAFRFVFFVLLQGLLMHQVSNALINFRFIQLMFYPLFIFLLPAKMSTIQSMFLAFLMGIAVDFFYSSIGVHASALVFTAYLKPLVAHQMQIQTTTLGRKGIKIIGIEFPDFIKMAFILLLLHNLFYFLMIAFTFTDILNTLILTVISTIASIVLMIMYLLIFQPNR